MPTNRFGYSDDFVLNNGNVGINSAIPQEKLDVAGSVRGDNVRIAGVSSFTTYEGFLNANQNIVENINLEAGQGITGSLSGEVIVGTGITVTGIGSATSGQGYVDSLKVYNTFTVPSGGTLDRPSKAKPGQLYYNRDFATIEFYTGTVWRQVDNTTQRGRGVFGGGYSSTNSSIIDFVNIASTGNAQDFGNLTQERRAVAAVSSNIRGLFAGGISNVPAHVNTIDYITVASQGNAIDFGDFSSTSNLRQDVMACSSSTRGLFAGGYTPTPVNAALNVIDYVEIATLGNAIDFDGDLRLSRKNNAAAASPVRAVFAGGRAGTSPAPPGESKIDTVLFSSKGTNATDFGDLTAKRFAITGCSSSVRGIFAGGYQPAVLNVIESITISSLGNAIDFGSLSTPARSKFGTSTQVRGVFAGGRDAVGQINNIEYVTIMTTGNALDFGDLTVSRRQGAGLSDSHGGLGGF